MSKKSRLISIPEAAKHYSVCTKTLRRYISDGRITAYRIGPRMLRVDLDEVDAALLAPIGGAK